MPIFLPTIILRHRKENLKKCSLSGLEGHPALRFYRYPDQMASLPPLDRYLILDITAPVLSEKDSDAGLLLVDGTWKYAQKMLKALPLLQKRSLPHHFLTAYPRKQTGCEDPERGLASVEALYIAHLLTKRSTESLLDHYHWKEEFLRNFETNFRDNENGEKS
jgi:pre-rRNA-processing protein TSR3